MTRQTSNHDYTVPVEGDDNYQATFDSWFDSLDRDIEIRDEESNLSNYQPYDGAKFIATDTGKEFTGDGSQWVLDDKYVDTLDASTANIGQLGSPLNADGNDVSNVGALDANSIDTEDIDIGVTSESELTDALTNANADDVIGVRADLSGLSAIDISTEGVSLVSRTRRTLDFADGAKLTLSGDRTSVKNLALTGDTTQLSGAFVEITGADVEFKHNEVDGQAALGEELGGAQGVAPLDGADDATIAYNEIHNIAANGMLDNIHVASGYAERLTVVGNEFYDGDLNCDAIALQTSDSTIRGNYIHGKYQQGIGIGAKESLPRLADNTVENNVFEWDTSLDPTVYGGDAMLEYVQSGVSVTPENNTFKDNYVDAWGASHGQMAIKLIGRGSEAVGNTIKNPQDSSSFCISASGDESTIRDNDIDGGSTATTLIRTDNVVGVDIRHNECKNGATYGIRNVNGGAGISVIDNDVSTDSDDAILIEGGVPRTTVRDNEVDAGGNGVVVEGASSRIRDNFVKGGSTGIIAYGVSDTPIIEGNDLANTSATRDIWVYNPTEVTSARVQDNQCDGGWIEIDGANLQNVRLSGNENYVLEDAATRTLVNGVAQQALGGSAPSTPSNWDTGDVVEDTDNAGDAYKKLPSSGFTQIGT